MFDDDKWQNFREECLKATKARKDSIIKEFLKSAKYMGTVGYHIDTCERTADIYTKNPGILIGRAGQNVFDFERRLSEEFGGEWKVKFTEVSDGFVSSRHDERHSPCVFCMYNPPSSCDGKPCSICPACAVQE